MQPSNTYQRPTGAQGRPVDSGRMDGRGLAGRQGISTIQENIDESIDEEFEIDGFDDSSENLTKEQILKREADKKAVRDHEQKKSRVGRAADDLADIGLADESGITLNRLWKKIRDFLNDVDLEGEKIELLKGQEPARIRFMTACQRYADPKGNPSHLTFDKVKTAFNSAYLKPMPTDQELRNLFRGLEAYFNEELQIVNWSKILDAMVHREHSCIGGIFPRIMIKGEVGADGKQADTDKQSEALKEIARIQDEQQKRLEAKEKSLEKLRKQDQMLSKTGVATKPGAKPAAVSKDEIKRQEREAQLEKEEQRLLQIELAKIESANVKKDAEAFSKRFNAIVGKFREAGTATQLINSFRLYDKSGSGKLEIKEFTKGMLECKIHVNPDEITYVYGAIDDDSYGLINYKEFTDYMFGFKQLDVQKFIAERRQRLGLNSGLDPKLTAAQAQASQQPNFDANEYLSAGSVGLSSVMKRSDNADKQVKKLVDETEPARNFNTIKDRFTNKFFSFEELLQTMQMAQAKPGSETKIMLRDFERAVFSATGGDLSAFQIRQVFMLQAVNTEQGPDKAHISLRDFKDLYFPARPWQPQYVMTTAEAESKKNQNQINGEDQDDNYSEASMLIDNIMQGKAIDDILAERNAAERKALMEEELARQASIKDDFDMQSNYSERIDQIISIKSGGDPRSRKDADVPFFQGKKTGKGTAVEAPATQNGSQFGNQTFYRQPEVKSAKLTSYQTKLLGSKSFDLAVDKILIKFVDNLLGDLQTADKKTTPDYGSYVDRYGKEFPGSLTFNEVKEIYMAHVHFTEMTIRKQAPPDDNLLRALYNTISTDQRNKISKEDFVNFLRTREPPSFLHRLQMKIRRGAGRLVHALQDECQNADIVFGANGLIPLPAFQTIMSDYDLPILESDKQLLKDQGFVKLDHNKNELVEYKGIFQKQKPAPQQQDMTQYLSLILKTQKLVRGFLARKQVQRLKEQNADSQLKGMKDQVQALHGKKSKAKEPEASEAKKDDKAKQGKMTKEDQAKKKDAVAKAQRQGRREQQTIDKKMSAVVKPVRDQKAAERQARLKQEITDFIKNSLIEQMIVKAYCYGESLEVCRTIQHKYENRPVTKFVYPLLQQFQISSQGVISKSLQPFNALGQVMYLNAQNQLQQYDIATKKTLAPVSLGTRPPLKHYNIIDMVVDQRSGRIYTINSNWILEIWNIEQNASFPQKRIAVCSNEGGKDFVSLYYENTFNDAKPRFLCLQESNQQVLVVNTTCVDGCIVFIDPISFSILKKIQLRYVDYELPAKVRQSIKRLSQVFDKIRQEKGKDIITIFSRIVDMQTQEVSIRNLVDHLCELDSSLTRHELFETVINLDEDGSGNISLDEFLTFFGQVDLNDEDEFQKAQEEQLLQDELWPSWVLDEGKLAQAQTLLLAMFTALEKNHSITPEAAFGIYDMTDRGFSTQTEFKRIIKIFFGDVIPEGPKLDFIMRLTVATVDGKIRYREFCRFLAKRFVKTFKLASKASDISDDQNQTKQKTALEIELERPSIKEASLSYILRKAAELQIDIRKEFQAHDPLELSVISRVQFWGVLLSLPLGLNEDELMEIFDNDLNYDNNGNVDYISILNSDIFVALERKRIQTQAFKRQSSKEATNDVSNKEGATLSDNRKVVVEDLIFIDDLEIIIYTTVRPKTSTIFITSMCKTAKIVAQDNNKTQIVELGKLDTTNIQESLLQINQDVENEKIESDKNSTEAMFPLIAKLRGHKNDGAPSICFIPQSNCLVSSEKHVAGNEMPQDMSNMARNDDPSQPISHKVQGGKTGYTQYTQRHQKGNMKCEILVWNLQRDMIELFSTNYPWYVPPHKKFQAHDASIIDICYLVKSQLLVTCGMDQTIRFWDPVQSSYELTDPSNNPHAQMKPGYYKPLQPEQTKSNATFKEIKRVYCGNDTNCFALRTLCIQNVILNAQQPDIKSQIEWLICLKNPVQNSINKEQAKKNRVGIICGYGIERVKIEIPAKHVDDIVPPYVMKECEELVEQRRRKIVTAFQKQMPVQIERIYSQTQLQNSYMEKIRGLFMQAILNRKDGQFVNPIPLREVYQIILKLPTRTKFESFLASSGCSDKLSVSETFFYLQKFMQIHPLRTTQIEFEKSIEDFYKRHQRQFLKGVKRWPKQAIQKFANLIRQQGLDISFLKEPSKQQSTITTINFCTRERFIDYFLFLNSNPPHVFFHDEEVQQILDELDPYQTGAIQINLVEQYFREEIEYFKILSLKRPQEIIENIRNVAFPNKKIALQQALAAADELGDGYITKQQYIDAMLRADIKVERDQLELLFDVMSERFDQPKNEEDFTQEVKHLNLPFFYSKLFTKSEINSVSEVDLTLTHIKAALIYKGVDFGIVFAEQVQDDAAQTKNRKAAGPRKTSKETKIDLTCHYSRFAQQIVKQEFCDRVAQLNAFSITPDKIMRLANYLSLNQKNQSVIYLNTWMHHLRRVNTQFQVADRAVLPIICSKLLKNESVFRSLVESIGLLKQKREEEKFCEQADLRQVLKKFGISYINQGLFLQEFTKGSSVHLQDLIARMKACVKSHYNTAVSDMNEKRAAEGPKQLTLQDLQKTDYFDMVQKRIKKYKAEINISQLLTKLSEFDESDTGMIHAYKLINVLKHQLPGLLDEQTLIGLQYELECLSYEHLVDYSEFVKIFLQSGSTGKKLNVVAEIKLDMKKSAYTLNEYEDLLGRISEHVKSQGLDLMHIFEIFCKKSGFISYADLRKIIDLIDFAITDKQFELLCMYADEEGQQNVHAYELAQQIENAEVVAPQFDIQKWIIASRELAGRHHLLALVYDVLPQIKDQIHAEFSEGKPGFEPNVLTGQQFQAILRKEVPQISEHDVDLLTIYSIRGSRRAPQNGEMANAPIQIHSDLVQFAHFERALNEVVNDMRKQEIQRKQKQQEALIQEAPERQVTKPVAHTTTVNADLLKRESQLISKVTQLFREREISFFDCFQQHYDPLSEKNTIPIKLFKELINKLNLPLTVQDLRIMRRIADPNGIGKVELRNFCGRFDTQDLRMIRLNQTLDKIATSFYIQNFNLKKAFQLFDVNGDGIISKEELRQGFAALEIGIKYDEINDLMRLITTTADGKISYDDFIAKMDANIRHRRSSLQHLVEDQVFTKIAECLMYSGESLLEAMKVYDTTSQGQIQARDLTRVFKRIGLSQIEPHMPLVLKTGGIRVQDQVVGIEDFCSKFMQEIGKRTKQSGVVRVQTINKLHSLLRASKTSLFDFFVKLDTNSSGAVSKLELKTGIQQMNLTLNREEFEMLWSMLYKPKSKVNTLPTNERLKKDALRPQEPEITYYDLIQGFIQSGAIKFNKTSDRADVILGKFRQQMKRLNLTVEKLYKAYDPKDLRYVFKNDFIETSMLLGLEFSEDELIKIFEGFCAHGEKDNQKQQQTRFTFKQMHDCLLVQKDQNWIYMAYIKIHSVVLQKGLTYKRLFTQWKTGKQTSGKLGAQEIAVGLKKLKAGLTQDEVEKLVAQLKYEGKEHVISDRDFENTVIAGAQKLEQEQSYERMLLAGWIDLFNEQINKNYTPIDNLFAEYDSGQDGNMSFDDFAKMNEASSVNMNRKDLHRIFDLIDRQKNGIVRLDDIRRLSSYSLNQEDSSQDPSSDQPNQEEGLTGNDILARQKINDIYEELKTKIETKNTTLEQVLFTELKFEQNGLATTSGVRAALEKLGIVLSTNEAEYILKDVRKHNYGKFECTYKNLVDFMTKNRINVAFVEKGFIDPLLANTVQALNRVKDVHDFTYEHLFRILDAEEKKHFSKEQFMICLQGMDLGCAVEDIIELFNYMDDQNINRVSQQQFVNAMTFISQRMGGPSVLEQSMSKGLIQAKKGVTNMQLVFSILKRICEAVERRRLTIKQLNAALDINKTGYLSRAEFVTVIHNLSDSITLDHIRVVVQFLDDRNTGKVSIFEFLKIILEILNQQIGGGVYAFMQVQPIIQKIINELSIDCDKFFDEIADKNEAWLEQQRQGTQGQFKQCGLMKSIFTQTLNKYGVTLSEKENALISSVFGLTKLDRDKLDYAKIDAAFEGVQQQLYAQESQYTKEWERRVFKLIGDYLMRLNISIHNCFSMIDTDDSQTISMAELQNALIRFDLGLSNSQTKAFLARLDPQNLGYITQAEFIQRFWSAYTYDDVFGEEAIEYETTMLSAITMPTVQVMSSHNIIAANQRMKSQLDQKVTAYRMFKSVQMHLKQTKSIQEAFVALDTKNHGYLTLRDFQINLSKHFNLSLKASEVRSLFQEIDSDENGIIKFRELDDFYNSDYSKKVKNVQKERQDKFAQNEIFDHLMKVLKQRGLTLQAVFDEIDQDNNNYIEVDEFQDMLERMGFTITQEQVFELMKTMDDNFDGRISYNEMKQHFEGKLGFQIDEPNETQSALVGQRTQTQQKTSEHRWRDKALELLIKTIKSKVKGKQLNQYFEQYDNDHDGHLTPTEFRKACMDLREPMLKQTQIERILHIVLEERKLSPLASVERICRLLGNYKYIQLQDGTPGNTSVLIDEDLFVYIVEKYDGISRMMEFVAGVEDKSTYLQRHIYELGMRGLNMMSNQKQILKLNKKAETLNELYQSTLVLLAGDISRLIKEEAVLTVLDPSKNVDTIISDENVGVLTSVSLPTIENSQFDVNYQSLTVLPCGAQRYTGTLMSTKEPIEILLYPSENLQYVSLDGKAYKRHLATELQIHRYLMGARFEEDDEMVNPDAFNDADLDIFANIGKFEKKIGLSANDKEIYVVNKDINEDHWINLDDFVTQNGGILNIPLFYHTDAPLYIIRHWAKLILKIISKVHSVSVVLRSLSTRQLWISRDGKRIRLGHVRGAGRVNNLGFLKSCPDIYLNLDNNERGARDENKSTGFSPSKGGGLQSSRRTNNDTSQKMFSNRALDTAFIAPEVLFTKFSDHTAAMDVWAFGMIMFSLIFGRKPVSYYQIYRQWLLKCHQVDAEMGNLPFVPPSAANFIYDPFSIDFENPFDNFSVEDLAQTNFKSKATIEDLENSFKQKDGTLNFENFMKCISDLSYSGMFTKENSKKFSFERIVTNREPEQQKLDASLGGDQVPIRFAGQQNQQASVRKQFLLMMAKQKVLERKNELGLILDLISACVDIDPKKRPTIQGLLHSPIFQLDAHENTNAIRFSQNVILFRSPSSTVSQAITAPLRAICAETLKSTMGVYDHTDTILKLFVRVEDAIQFQTALPLDELNEVLTENEKRKGITQHMASKGVDASKLRVAPNSPLAAQVIEDKVIEMLLFLTFRFIKNFHAWKQRQISEMDMRINLINQQDQPVTSHGTQSQAASTTNKSSKSKHSQAQVNQHEEVKKNVQRLENQVLQRMTHLLKTIVYQMHSYNTPMAPYVSEVIQFVVKFFIGEEHFFGSDVVLSKTTQQQSSQKLKAFLRDRSFFRRESELDSSFKSDQADKLWHLEQKNKTFLDKSNYWCPELYNEALKIYRDAITESGRGQSCYPVICDFITSVTNSFEPTKIFSKQMSHLSMSYLIPMNRTSAYYNELIPIAESLSRLYNPDLEKAGKRCSLAMVRSVFQTGNSDKIKACLDMRVPKHLVHFIQDSDQEVRKECLFTYLEISKGLQDDDFEVIGKHAANLKREFSKQGYTKTAFDLHKAVSMASQSEVLDAQAKIDKINATNRRGGQARQQSQVESISQTEAQCNYIKRTIALIEKNENEKYINFALDLPNLNFLASKRFLKEMAVCFESPVFIAPLVRLLKTPTELHPNKVIVLDIFKNLVCGNEKVLIALNSPACDTYMTLLKNLMMNTKMAHARQNPSSQGVSTQMKQTLALQDKTVELFTYMFEQRRPTIIRDISCIGASSTLLKEQDLHIPLFISLPDIVAFFDDFAGEPVITPAMINVDDFISHIKDLRCWVKHFFAVSTIPELTRIKAMQRCMNLLIRVLKVVWREYFRVGYTEDGYPPCNADTKINYMLLIRTSLSFFDWLCINNKFQFLFNEESGRTNLAFIINTCNMILCQFRKPLSQTTDSLETAMPPMEDLTFNDRSNKAVQDKRRYDIFPFTDIGSILQNIQYQLVRKNDAFLNQLLSEANFGFIFGEQLLLEYDFIRHCIDNCVESLVLMDSYVKKNEIRLNTFEFILRSSEDTIKDQLIKSNFCERIFLDYIRDFREFNIQFSKIDLEFLAFRRSYPLRLEAISLINTTLMLRNYAPQMYTEFLMYSRRHLLIRQELGMLSSCMAVNSKEATCLLLFAVLLESNETDLVYVMVQEGAHRVIRTLMQEQPSLNKRFPILREFINKF